MAGNVTFLGLTLSTFVMTSYCEKSLMELDMLYSPKHTEVRTKMLQASLVALLSVFTILGMPCTVIDDMNLLADSLTCLSLFSFAESLFKAFLVEI